MIYTVPRDVNNASGMLQYQSTVVDDTSQTVQFTFSFSIYMCLILCVFLCQCWMIASPANIALK